MADLVSMSEATALGLHAAAVLALAEGPTPTAAVASALQASEAHVSKVLQRLTRAGVLRSKRGRTGGYSLARCPSAIRLLDVYQALEGPIRQGRCLFPKPRCGQGTCILGGLVERIRQDAQDHLRRTTLADLVVSARR